MQHSSPTLPFYIRFKTGKEEIVDYPSFEQLRKNHLESEDLFDQKIDSVSWKEKTTLVTYSAETKEFTRSIADGDVNPYGWRMNHR
jgi:hypothetical protein